MLSDPIVYPTDPRVAAESAVSAISWPAILGGAITAAAVSLVLVLLGSGLGLASISPWSIGGGSATVFSIAAGLWLVVVQWLSSGLGGFVTGRLRTKWVHVHTHEVFFRDTAHGLLTWGLATVIGALVLASSSSSVVGTTTRAAAIPLVAAPLAQSQAYIIDTLFRGEKAELASSYPRARDEAVRIFANGARNGDIPAADRTYLAGLVATQTSAPQTDAEKRVDVAIVQEKAAETAVREATDAARKSAAAIAIFTALSMLIGAFIASIAAAYGGNLRDEHP
jgi:hypothetical protein